MAVEGEVVVQRGGGGDELAEVKENTLRLWALRTLVLVVALGLWELAAGRVIETFWVSKPSLIIARLARWVGNGSLFFHFNITMQEALAGFFIGASSGLVIGFILAQTGPVAKVLDAFIMGLYSLPKLALAPLLILWFGIGIKTKIVLATVIVFFVVFWNSFYGVRDVDQELVDVLKVMGANLIQINQKILLPSALVWVFLSLKISVPLAIVGAVVGEIIASNRGLGFMLMSASGQFDTAGVFAVLFVLMIFATVLNEVVERSQNFVLRWKVAGR